MHIKCLLTSERTILVLFGATFGSYAVVCCFVVVEHYFGTGLDIIQRFWLGAELNPKVSISEPTKVFAAEDTFEKHSYTVIAV